MHTCSRVRSIKTARRLEKSRRDRWSTEMTRARLPENFNFTRRWRKYIGCAAGA